MLLVYPLVDNIINKFMQYLFIPCERCDPKGHKFYVSMKNRNINTI